MSLPLGHLLGESELVAVRMAISHFLVSHILYIPLHVADKAAKVAVDAGKLEAAIKANVGGEKLPDLIKEWIALGGPSGTILLCVALEEMGRSGGRRPHVREVQMQNIRSQLSHCTALAVDTLGSILETSLRSLSLVDAAGVGNTTSPNNVLSLDAASFMLKFALRGVVDVMSPSHPCRFSPGNVSPGIFHALLELVEASVRGLAYSSSYIGALSVGCLTEVLLVQPLPPALEAIPNELSSHMMRILQLRLEMGEGGQLDRESLDSSLGEFLLAFVERHLVRMLGTTTTKHPSTCASPSPSSGLEFASLMGLMARLCFECNALGGLNTHAALWSAILQHLGQSVEGGGMGLDPQCFVGGLTEVGQAFLRSILFSSNSGVLEAMENDSHHPTSGAGARAGGGDDLEWDEDVYSSLYDGSTVKSEFQACISSVSTLLVTMSKLPCPELGLALRDMTLTHLQEAFTVLELSATADNRPHVLDLPLSTSTAPSTFLPGQNQREVWLWMDAGTLFGVAASLVDESEQGLVVVRAIQEGCVQVLRCSKGAAHPECIVAALKAFGATAPILGAAVKHLRIEEAKYACDAVAYALELGLLHPAEEVKIAASFPFMCFAQTLPPDFLGVNQGMLKCLNTPFLLPPKGEARNNHHHQGLGAIPLEKLYIALTCFIIPPSVRLHTLSDASARANAFRGLITPLIDRIIESSAVLSMESSPLQVCKTAAALVPPLAVTFRVLGRIYRYMSSGCCIDGQKLLIDAAEPSIFTALVTLIKPCWSIAAASNPKPLHALLWLAGGAIGGMGKTSFPSLALSIVQEVHAVGSETPLSDSDVHAIALHLLKSTLKIRFKSISSLVLDVTELSLNFLSRSGDTVAMEFLAVSKELLCNHFGSFVKSRFNESLGSVKQSVNERSALLLSQLCAALCSLVIHHTSSLEVPVEAMKQMLKANEQHGLFKLEYFSPFFVPLSESILHGLEGGEGSSLGDGDAQGIAEALSKADPQVWATTVLPAFLSSFTELDTDAVAALLQYWHKEWTMELILDIRYYRAVSSKVV